MSEPTYIPLTRQKREMIRDAIAFYADNHIGARVDAMQEIAADLESHGEAEAEDAPPTTWAALTTLQVGERVRFKRGHRRIENGSGDTFLPDENDMAEIVANELERPSACLVVKIVGSPFQSTPGDPWFYLHAPMRGSSFDESQPPPIELVSRSHGNAEEDRT